MKRSIVIFPIKQYSERVKGKNFLLVGGKPLYQIFPTVVLASGKFDRVVVDTDSPTIKDWARSVGIDVLDRLPEHATDQANGNTLLRHHVKTYPDYDYYWQAFVTSPYISVDTVRRMADALATTPRVDSVLSVEALAGMFWDGRCMPINHRAECMPRSQDLPLVYREVCGLFGVTAEGFECTQTRAGRSPLLWPLPASECLDIDWPTDVPR